MSKPRFPATLETDVDEIERRLRILERSQGISAAISGGDAPLGAVIAYWGATAPAGWLLCDGASFSAVTYPDLAAHLGGTTLPNLKGKVIAGVDGSQTEFDTLGETGGSKTIVTADMPSHHHNVGAHTHQHDHEHDINPALTPAFGTSDSAHAHYIGGAGGEGSTAPQNAGGGTGRAASTWNGGPTQTANTANPTDTSGPNGSTDTGNTGGGTIGGKLPPYMALSWIIKAN